MKKFLVLSLMVMAVSLWAESPEYKEAVNLIRRQQYTVAVPLLNAALAKEGDSPRIQYAIGFCAENNGQKELAKRHYSRAIAMNLNTADDYEWAKRSRSRLGELYPELAFVLNKAWELHEAAINTQDSTARVFIQDAAQKLYNHALSGDDWERAKAVAASNRPVRTEVEVTNVDNRSLANKNAEMEKHLGYRLGKHRIGAVRGGNGHYYMFFEGQISWEEARKRCQEMGGYLATVTCKAEFDFLYKYTKPNLNQAVWIGGSMQNSQIKWITGENIEEGVPFVQVDNRYTMCVLDHGSNIRPILPTGRNASGVPLVKGFICEWNY
jgi:tetratricopeptide (TPR) repeat protein